MRSFYISFTDTVGGWAYMVRMGSSESDIEPGTSCLVPWEADSSVTGALVNQARVLANDSFADYIIVLIAFFPTSLWILFFFLKGML